MNNPGYPRVSLSSQSGPIASFLTTVIYSSFFRREITSQRAVRRRDS